MTYVIVAVITALCFAFASTRKWGIAGTGLLLFTQPYLTIGVLLLAAVAFYYFYWRKSHV